MLALSEYSEFVFFLLKQICIDELCASIVKASSEDDVIVFHSSILSKQIFSITSTVAEKNNPTTINYNSQFHVIHAG